MLVVYKYPLTRSVPQNVVMPIGSKILSVKEQHSQIVVYALVNTEETMIQEFDFFVLGTGYEVTPELLADYKFLDTVKMINGSLMFHVFYLTKE